MSECSLYNIIEMIGGISLNAIYVILKWEMVYVGVIVVWYY